MWFQIFISEEVLLTKLHLLEGIFIYDIQTANSQYKIGINICAGILKGHLIGPYFFHYR